MTDGREPPLLLLLLKLLLTFLLLTALLHALFRFFAGKRRFFLLAPLARPLCGFGGRRRFRLQRSLPDLFARGVADLIPLVRQLLQADLEIDKLGLL